MYENSMIVTPIAKIHLNITSQFRNFLPFRIWEEAHQVHTLHASHVVHFVDEKKDGEKVTERIQLNTRNDLFSQWL